MKKLIAIIIVVGLSYLAAVQPRNVKQSFGIDQIKTDSSQTYKTAFCWWCSCYVVEPGQNGMHDYLVSVVTTLQ